MHKYALAAALVLGSASGAMASTLNIALDGFCNTFTLNVSGVLVAGTRQGCGYTVLDGGTVAKVGKIPYTISADTNDQKELFTWYFSKPVKKHGSFYLYSSDGTTDTLITSGTYSETVTPSVNRGGRDITAK